MTSPTITQADIEIVDWFAEEVALELGALFTEEMRSDALNMAARHREAAEARARIEGARMMQEAALVEVCTDRTIEKHGAHCCCTTCELNCAEDGIRTLSPEAIVKGEV